MKAPKKRAKGGGRKPQGEFSGKTAKLNTRLTPTTRAALERTAREHRLSISQLAEKLLADGLALGGSKMADRIYGTPGSDPKQQRRWGENRALAVLTGKLASSVEAMTDQSWRSDLYTHKAVEAGLAIILDYLAPPLDQLLPPDRILNHFPHWKDDPKGLGASFALALIDNLRLHAATPVPTNGTQFSDEYWQFPHLRRALGLAGANQGDA